MRGRSVIPRPQHHVAFAELTDLLNRHAAEMSAEEMLAIAANMVGKLIALQDQRTMTRERALETVMRNIEMGNEQALRDLAASQGRA